MVMTRDEKYRGTVIWSNIALAVVGIGLLTLCAYVSDGAVGRAYNYLTTTLGALVGWTLGVYWAPYSSSEQKRFVTIGQAVGTFLSGYVLSKLDRVLEESLFEDAGPHVEGWVRLGLFMAALLLVMLTVYTNRMYYKPDDAGNRTDTKTASGGGGESTVTTATSVHQTRGAQRTDQGG